MPPHTYALIHVFVFLAHALNKENIIYLLAEAIGHNPRFPHTPPRRNVAGQQGAEDGLALVVLGPVEGGLAGGAVRRRRRADGVEAPRPRVARIVQAVHVVWFAVRVARERAHELRVERLV